MQTIEESWVDRLRAGSSTQNDAIAALREVLLVRLRKTFRGRSGIDETFLEDVVQQTLMKTLEKIDQFQGKSRFTTWATTIAVHVAFTERRRRYWKDVSLDQILAKDPYSDANVSSTDHAPQHAAEQNALVAEMYRIIDTDLSEKQRKALLAELKGMPLEAIGRCLNSNRNAVYKLTCDARQRIKKGLEAAGYTIEDLFST